MDKAVDKVHMFIGEYNHTIDPKKRLSIPARLRKELGDKAILTRGLDKCLFLYPQHTWQTVAEKLSKLSVGQADTRNFVRFMLAQAFEVEFDSLGRILVPDYLKQHANLSGRAIIVGVYDRIEIWSPERWTDVRTHAEENANQLAERLGDLGVY